MCVCVCASMCVCTCLYLCVYMCVCLYLPNIFPLMDKVFYCYLYNYMNFDHSMEKRKLKNNFYTWYRNTCPFTVVKSVGETKVLSLY